MMTYTVTAKRWEHGWELHIDGVGVTQSRSLAEAERMVRDYIALDFDVAPDSFAVDITPEITGSLGTELAQARRAVAEAAEAQREAAVKSRGAARRLEEAGLSGRDIASVIGLSPQRVSQLLSDQDRRAS